MSMYLWEEALETLAKKGFVVCPNTLSPQVTQLLRKRAQREHQEGTFRPARIGQGAMKQEKQQLRNDHIRWIENWQADDLKATHAQLEDLHTQLRQFLFLPIKRFESHLAYYEPGSFYVRHRDRHRYHPSRLITAVLYLNTLSPEDGGELCLYTEEGEVRITPQEGQLCLFLSETEHEVLPTQAPRWTLTTWFRDDIVADLNLRRS